MSARKYTPNTGRSDQLKQAQMEENISEEQRKGRRRERA
jgi:hypothetical protein